jgi:hypothetical protein
MNTNKNTKEITYISTSNSLIESQTKYAKKSEDSGLVFAPYIIGECTSTITSVLLEEAKLKVSAVNRERQMDSVLEDKEFVPYTIEETEEYKKFQETYFGKTSTGIKYRYATVNVTSGTKE